MAGKFIVKKFKEININDPFFDSLKEDYLDRETSVGFEKWFYEKAAEGRKALVYEDQVGIAAFIALKKEKEEICLREVTLPVKERVKVCTLKISERHRGERYGEGAIGLMLWCWKNIGYDEIYVTVFEKQLELIILLEKFGFKNVGHNLNGECVFLKDKKNLEFSCPYKSFPFTKSDFDYAGYLIIEDHYHDTMFAYSELAGKKHLNVNILKTVGNGLTKTYIGRSPVSNHYIGEPIFIYRKYTEGPRKKYKSCITSYAIVTDVIQVKEKGQYKMTFEQLKDKITNKSVFSKEELKRQYLNNWSMNLVELLYVGYFGAGNNVNLDWLINNKCWITAENYPTEIHLSKDQFEKILEKAKIDVSNVLI